MPSESEQSARLVPDAASATALVQLSALGQRAKMLFERVVARPSQLDGIADGDGTMFARKNAQSYSWTKRKCRQRARPDRGFFPIDTVYFVKSELPNSFLYFLLRSMNFINNDSAVPGLNRNQAYSNLFFLPPVPLINKYAEVADSPFEMKRYLTRQNENLIAARDRLLPRLISGKLSVENLDIRFPPGMEEAAHAA